jgi:formylglycine-generating enzyme
VRVTLVAMVSLFMQPAPAPPTAPPPMLKNSVGMELVLIQPGTLLVGRFEPACPSPPDPDSARCQEIVERERRSGFTVRLERAYYIGKYEVTQAEWIEVMGANPSVFKKTARHPVDSVTWDDAQRFVQRLNAREKTTAYRLPTEFEWEYAARAGASSDPAWDEIRELAWEQDIETAATHPVGLKKANRWGLHDMLGNVWEWVADYYNDKIFADPVRPAHGTTHVLKGGGFLSDVKNTTYSTHAAGPGDGFDVGFRIVRDLPVR